MRRPRSNRTAPAPSKTGRRAVRPELDALLETLDREQLQALVQNLARREPELLGEIQGQVREHPSESNAATGDMERSLALIRRQVQESISRPTTSPSANLDEPRQVLDRVREIVEQTLGHVETGDNRSALAMLAAIVEECIANVDRFGSASNALFEELGLRLCEEILSADLTVEERQAWVERLGRWQDELVVKDVEAPFEAARAAAQQGWDDLQLQHVLAGDVSYDVWQNKPPWFADDVSIARLHVLERQGRLEQALHLAESEDLTEQYVTLLVKLDRIREAIRYAREQFVHAEEALALAQALFERHNVRQAFRMAEHGLTLAGERLSLARWWRDAAIGSGEHERALQAGLAALRVRPNLADYEALRSIAGDGWAALQPRLWAGLREKGSRFPVGVGEIYLQEGRIDEAIQITESLPPGSNLREKVVDAVIENRPDWAMRACRLEAEALIDPARPARYPRAVVWLKKGSAASVAAHRQDEWRQYIRNLADRHQRKRNLVRQLQDLL
jgi:uncharacterized Zn finger protein